MVVLLGGVGYTTLQQRRVFDYLPLVGIQIAENAYDALARFNLGTLDGIDILLLKNHPLFALPLLCLGVVSYETAVVLYQDVVVLVSTLVAKTVGECLRQNIRLLLIFFKSQLLELLAAEIYVDRCAGNRGCQYIAIARVDVASVCQYLLLVEDERIAQL